MNVTFQVAGRETDTRQVLACRRMLVGPWCNQPEEYEGYNGFVGWPGLTILKSGRWLLPFSSGYWHASFPLTHDLLQDPESNTFFQDMRRHGCTFVNAPRGGRAHLMHSDDQGLTWTRPATLIDTAYDDRHPSILELDNGDWVANFFEYWMPAHCQARYMRSRDRGATWTEPQATPGNGGGFGANPMIQLADGSLVWVIEGYYDPQVTHPVTGVFRSENRGESFELASVVNPGHVLEEPSVVELADGRLLLIGRRQDDLCWSADGGRTWSAPVSAGVELFDPHLLRLPSGVLACFHGSYAGGGLRVMLSTDGGQTWRGPKAGIGYSVDPHVYGYSAPAVLPDGSVYIAYLHSGGHAPADARTEAIWGLRITVNEAADGITLHPAPGSPAARGAAAGASTLAGLEGLATHGGDPELGELRRAKS